MLFTVSVEVLRCMELVLRVTTSQSMASYLLEGPVSDVLGIEVSVSAVEVVGIKLWLWLGILAIWHPGEPGFHILTCLPGRYM